MRAVPAALKKYLHRINPKVVLATEIRTVLKEDKINTKSDWTAATQSPASTFDIFDDGSVTLKETDLTAIDHTANDIFATSLGSNTPTHSCGDGAAAKECAAPAVFAAFELSTALGTRARLRKVKLWLTRQRVGGNPQFDGVFKLELFTIAWYSASNVLARDFGFIVPIADPIFVNARDTGLMLAPGWPVWPLGATDTGLITFDFTLNQIVTIGALHVPQLRAAQGNISDRTYVRRIVLAKVTAINETTGGTNVGLGVDSAAEIGDRIKTVGGHNLFQFQTLVTIHNPGVSLGVRNAVSQFIIIPGRGTFTADHQFIGIPRVEFIIADYPTGTSDIEKVVDLGAAPAAPADVEFGAIFIEPAGTTVTPQVKDTVSAYQTFKDGDTAADLGLAASQTYTMRYRFAPNAAEDTSPTGFELSCREQSSQDVTDLVNVSGGDYAVDPRSMRGEIRELSLLLTRDGRRDFFDQASRIAYENHPDRLEVALYIRADVTPIPTRDKWMLIDVFAVTEMESQWGAEALTCSSRLERLRRDIPRRVESAPSSGVFLRAPIEFSNASPETIYDTILSEAQVAARFKGQPPVNLLTDPDDGTDFAASLSKKIEKVVDAKKELDRVGFIMGGAFITKNGRIHFVEMLGPKESVALFNADDIVLGRTPRNIAQRTISFRVPYGFDEERNDFTSEVINLDGDALTNLGVPTIKRRASVMDDESAKYITDKKTARAVGLPFVRNFGAGVLFPWEFTSIIPHPELEPGDLVTIETDRITARDPLDNREIKGQGYGRAVVAGCNPNGTRIIVWVRSFSDILNVGNEPGDIGKLLGVAEILSTTVVEEAAFGARKVTRSVVPDVETKEIHVYHRRVASGGCGPDADWPTLDGLQAGTVDIAFRRAIFDVSTPGQNWTLTTFGLVTSNVVREIWVPVGFDQKIGVREEYCYPVTGTAQPQILTAKRNTTQNGTNCTPTSSRKIVKIDWTVNAATSDANQDMQVFRQIKIGGVVQGAGYILVKTEVSPATILTYSDEVPTHGDEQSSSGPLVEVDYRLDLVTTAGPTVEHSVSMTEDEIFFGVDCSS